jgi:hypothetical protein
MIRRTASERSEKGCCGQCLIGHPLKAVIAVVALGGVICTLSGIGIGMTGLTGSPAFHFTAALLMIGIGLLLVIVSGAAWRFLTSENMSCFSFPGTDCRRACERNRHGIFYPEFQHRPPPPSYQASMQEYRLRLLLLERDRQNHSRRRPSPPPTYRSNNGTLIRNPLNTSSSTNTLYIPASEGAHINQQPKKLQRPNSCHLLTTATTNTTIPTNEIKVQINNESQHEDGSDSNKTNKITTIVVNKLVDNTNDKLETQINVPSIDTVDSDNNNELVTIVSINGNRSEANASEFSSTNNNANEIEILAHL